MIQIITYNKSKFENINKQYKISSLEEFDSFDDYDINIIDLSNEIIWRYSGSSITSLNNISDLKTISKELDTIKKSKIIIVFPQNIDYKYEWLNYEKKYNKTNKIKNILSPITDIISKNLFKIEGFEISYSKTITTLNNLTYSADFNFNQIMDKIFDVITLSDNSNKITTIIYNKIILTTLDIFQTPEHLDNFILPLNISDKKNESIPEWIKEINFYNDSKLIDNKLSNIKKIESLKSENYKIDVELSKNNKFKSILYETGDKLVNVVMEILDDMLNNDSSNFIDEKKEDFLIKKKDITFVGEIKGISSAISNKNVSQLDVHVQSYIDKIYNDNLTEFVKGLLIINHQRTKKISERNEIHKNQIDLAKRNGSLIIESNVLLKLYEQFLLGNVDTDKVIKIFSDKIGVLTVKDIK